MTKAEAKLRKGRNMAVITMKDLLEAGCHFGHQTKRWNPKMKKYIFGARNGIYIIDLQKTLKKFKEAYQFIKDCVVDGGDVLFVGTKKQAQEAIEQESKRCQMFYVNQRWLGGMLTNFVTIRKSINKLKALENMIQQQKFGDLTKKEIIKKEKEMGKLAKNLAGIKDMERQPRAIFVIDPKKERIAIHEARTLRIPIVAIVDTNCDPDEIDYAIPGNDDAIRAIRLITSKIADGINEGRMERRAQLMEEVEGDEEEAPVIPEKEEGIADSGSTDMDSEGITDVDADLPYDDEEEAGHYSN